MLIWTPGGHQHTKPKVNPTWGFPPGVGAGRQIVPPPDDGIGYLHGCSSNVQQLQISLVGLNNLDHVARP